MNHTDNLILTLVAAFPLAFAFGMIATALRLSPLVGYLLAGVVIGPFTPGFVADTDLAPQLAEIGVILLMFGVGLHVSPRELMAVKRVALPGALVQIACATLLGWLFGHYVIGLDSGAALLLGFAVSIASTVVVLRALEEHALSGTRVGQAAIGWLVVEDIATVVALILLPLVSAPDADGYSLGDFAGDLAITLGKVTLFVVIMLIAGARILPWLVGQIAKTGSNELFTLGVLAISIGIAFVAWSVFGASFALGAFVAGLTLNGTPLGHDAADRSTPLRDAFSVLFFVSVGMLFDPAILWQRPLEVFGVLAIIVVGKGAAAFFIGGMLGLRRRESLVVGASLAQIGEFSFILGSLGVSFGVMTQSTYELIVAAALISITVNPFLFRAVTALPRHAAVAGAVETPAIPADEAAL